MTDDLKTLVAIREKLADVMRQVDSECMSNRFGYLMGPLERKVRESHLSADFIIKTASKISRQIKS